MGWYSKYRGQSFGRVLHFIYHYCGLQIAERVEIGNNDVFLHGKPFARIVAWEKSEFEPKEQDVPVFEFIGANKESYTSEQVNKRKTAELEGSSEAFAAHCEGYI